MTIKGLTPQGIEIDKREWAAYEELGKELQKRWLAGKTLARKVLDVQMALIRMSTHHIPESESDFDNYRDMMEKDEFSNSVRDIASLTSRYLAHKLRAVASTPNIFDVSEALALRLLQTDLKGVTCDDVQLPFRAFAVLIPRGLMKIYSEITGWHDMTMLLVGMGYWHDEDIDPKIPFEDRRAGPRMVILTYGEPNASSSSPQDDAILTLSVPMIPGTGLAAGLGVHRYPAGSVGKLANGTELGWIDMAQYTSRFVANLCLYLSNPNRDVVEPAKEQLKKLSGKKGRKAQERKARLRESRVYIVGGRERLSEIERAELLGGEIRSSVLRSLVRGHWRNQAHGPGRQERKLLWIKPHVRNKDVDMALKGRDYSVA